MERPPRRSCTLAASGAFLIAGIALVGTGCASRGLPQGSAEGMSVEAGTLQPMLRWPSIPHPRGAGTPAPGPPVAASSVTYDLRIWRAEEGHPVALAYEREGLPETSHRIDRTLEPSTEYLWSVRARFLLDGQVRVSDWTVLQAPRLPVVPHPFLRRFRTPPA